MRLLPSLASWTTTAGSTDGAPPGPARSVAAEGGGARVPPGLPGSNAATARAPSPTPSAPAAAAACHPGATSPLRQPHRHRFAGTRRTGRVVGGPSGARPWGIEGGRRPPRRPRPDGSRDSGFRPTSRLACSTQTRTTCQLARPQRPRLPGACGPHGNRRGGGDGGGIGATPATPLHRALRVLAEPACAAREPVAAVPGVATTQPLWGRSRRSARSHFPPPPGQMPLHALRRFLTVPVALQALGFRYGSRCTPEHGGHRIPPICGGVAGVAPFAAAAGGR